MTLFQSYGERNLFHLYADFHKMPQVAKRSANHFILNSVADLGKDQIIRVENHKNDRYLEIKRNGNRVEIREDGYTNTTHDIEITETKSLINRLIDYEFPRSHKLRIKIRKPDESSNIGMSPWSARKIR